MKYLVNETEYSLDYPSLRDEYNRIVSMDDVEFVSNLPRILHVSCVIAYLKEIPFYNLVSDKGVLHELIHLLHIPEEPLVDLKEIRETFNQTLKLS